MYKKIKKNKNKQEIKKETIECDYKPIYKKLISICNSDYKIDIKLELLTQLQLEIDNMPVSVSRKKAIQCVQKKIDLLENN